MYHLLYKTTCLINGKIYIGIHSTQDENDGYLGSGKALIASVKKYGKNNFQREILERLPSRKELIEAEKRYVNYDFVNLDTTYNLALGGSGYRLNSKIISDLNYKSKPFERWGDSFYLFKRSGNLINEDDYQYKPVYHILIKMQDRILQDLTEMWNNMKTHLYAKNFLNKFLQYKSFAENIYIESYEWECELNFNIVKNNI